MQHRIAAAQAQCARNVGRRTQAFALNDAPLCRAFLAGIAGVRQQP